MLAYGICFSLSDLFHSVWQSLGPSIYFCIWLSLLYFVWGSPRWSLCGSSICFLSFCIVFSWTNISLYVLLWMDVWFVPLLTTGENANHNVFWCTYTSGGIAGSALVGTAKWFSCVVVPVCTWTSNFQFSVFFVFCFFFFAILVIG